VRGLDRLLTHDPLPGVECSSGKRTR
jgi:hypothetical protein